MNIKAMIFRFKCRLLPFLLASFLSFQTNHLRSQNLTIECLANQGVIIHYGEQKIAIDAFFEKEFDFLDVLSTEDLQLFKKASGQFSDLNLILSTHKHGDHFSKELLEAHLGNNPGANAITTDESIATSEPMGRQLQTVSPQVGKTEVLEFGDLKITIYGLKHFGSPPWSEAENNAYLVEVGGFKVMHFGDGQITKENLEVFALEKEQIDLAIIAAGEMVNPGQKEVIEQMIGAKMTMAAHIRPATFDQAKAYLKQVFPDVLIYEKGKTIKL